MNAIEQRIRRLEEEIAQLKSQWPRHSVPPAMIQALEELEDALQEAQRQRLATIHQEKAVSDDESP